jgi:hypothetical protein
MLFRAVIPSDPARGDRRTPRADRLPPLGEPIAQAVAGHLRGHPLHKQFRQRREEETPRGDGRPRLKIVVGGCDVRPRFPPARAGTDLDRRLGIPRDPQDVVRRISSLIELHHVRKDGIGVWDLFCG